MSTQLSGGVSVNNTDRFKRQCTWSLSVTYFEDDEQTQAKTISVGYPLTISFNIQRNTFAQANTANFQIYNLAPSTRSSKAFFQDKFNTKSLKIVNFSAGYNGNLIKCFTGYILESYSARQNVDVVTNMQCMDMGTNASSYINMTFEAGTTRQEAFDNVIQNCEGLTKGYQGTLEGTFETPATFAGSPIDVLNQITEGHTFVDNGVAHTLQNNECLDVGVTVLQPNTGLLKTPQRREAQIIAESLFNPSVQVGQLLEITDPVFPDFNGTYKLCGFSHNGLISPTQAGERTTTYNLLIGDYLPSGSYNLTGSTDKQNFSKVKNNKVELVNGKLEPGALGLYNYIKSHNGALPLGQITKNISISEMLKHDNNDNDRMQDLTLEAVSNCFTIAQKLQNFKDAYFPGLKLEITSGWRSRRLNDTLGNAAKESAHLRGAAIDFRVKGMDTRSAYIEYFKYGWDRFTYLFLPTKGRPHVIHVQATFGEGGARRSSKSLA